MDEVAKAVQDTVNSLNVTCGNVVARSNGGIAAERLDPGVENIRKAGELSAQTFRDAYEEAAKRAVELAEANLERARNDLDYAQTFANALRQHGDTVASAYEASLGRTAEMANVMTSARKLIEERG